MTVGDSVREIRMTKKQRKRIIVKKLEAVLLGIILGAASVPTAKFTILAAGKDEKEENSGEKNNSDSSKKMKGRRRKFSGTH